MHTQDYENIAQAIRTTRKRRDATIRDSYEVQSGITSVVVALAEVFQNESALFIWDTFVAACDHPEVESFPGQLSHTR